MTTFQYAKLAPSGVSTELQAEEQEPPPAGLTHPQSSLSQPNLKKSPNNIYAENSSAQSIYSKQLSFRCGADRHEHRSVQVVHEEANEGCNKTENSSAQSIKYAEAFFGLQHWSQNTLHINTQGNLSLNIEGTPLDLFDLAQHLAKLEHWPVLLRFPALIKKNIHDMQHAFAKAMTAWNYDKSYTLAFPLKVNPHISVVKTMMQCENVTFEVGNKAELLIALTYVSHNHLILCNGFKDTDYLSFIIEAAKANQRVCVIFETLEELDLLAQITSELPANLSLGMRLRLNTPIAGHWEDSNGQHSKFGLSSLEVINAVENLKKHNFLTHLKLLHVHPGSQILAIKELSSCFKECIRYYHELLKLGAPIQTVDIGGGVAKDYSAEDKNLLRDYTLEDYALAIVKPMQQYCQKHNLPLPNLISETGRHTLALSSMLLTNVHPLGQQETLPVEEPNIKSTFIQQLWELHQFIVGFHNSEHAEAVNSQQEFLFKNIQKQFVDNHISLAELAWAEKICAYNHSLLAGPAGYQKYLANFSLFQSLPDYWGIEQFFPLLSLHGYQNELAKSAIFYDLTCDSDGVVKNYLHPEGIQSQLQLPGCPINFIGIFLMGAYQEIMASGHNLFERLPCLEINWTTDESGERTIETQLYPGCDIGESLVNIGYDAEELVQKSRAKFAQANDVLVEKYLVEMNYMRNETC